MLPDMGIFRKVELEAYDTDKIDDVFVYQNHKERQVSLDISVSTKHCKDAEVYISIDGKRVKAQDGKAEITIENPIIYGIILKKEKGL